MECLPRYPVWHPVLIHYGSFETTFLKRMCDRYGGPPGDSTAGKAISSSVNVLSVIFAQVYFPTYSNGLKEIAQFLGFEWGDPSSSGLQSIAWRHDWEASGDPTVREKLIAYNADDCEALCLVARTLGQISQPEIDTADPTSSESGIIHAESLGRNLTSKWRLLKARWLTSNSSTVPPIGTTSGIVFSFGRVLPREKRQSVLCHADP